MRAAAEKIEQAGISFKAMLVIALLATGLSPLVISTFASISVGSSALEEQASLKLEAIRETKGRYIESYFNTIRDQVETLAETTMTVRATQQFTGAFRAMGHELENNPALRSTYYQSLQSYYQD